MKIFKNKRAWLRIVEVFISIMIITGVLIMVLSRSYFGAEDTEKKVYNAEISILREIQLDDTYRSEILNSGTPPINWGEFATKLPKTKAKIEQRAPDYLSCQAKICAIESDCYLDEYPDKNVYAQSVIITVTKNSASYSPRRLKIFCSMK